MNIWCRLRKRLLIVATFGITAFWLSASVTAQDSIPDEIVNAWMRLSKASYFGAVIHCEIRDDSTGNTIWLEKYKRLDGNVIVESRYYDRPLRRLVRGPEYKFVFDEIDGTRNARSIVPTGEDLANGWDGHFERAEGLPKTPSHILGVPFADFFGRCSVIHVSGFGGPTVKVEYEMADSEGCKIWKECTGFKGFAQFDPKNEFRIVAFNYQFTNRRNVSVSIFQRIEYENDGPSNFTIIEGNADNNQIANKTRIWGEEGVPDESEFRPETYGIVVGTNSRMWWQKPTLWFSVIAAVCFVIAAFLRFRRRGTNSWSS